MSEGAQIEDSSRGLPSGLNSVQEIAFSLCMGAVAVLSRGNPLLVYPQVLWAFAALLSFNLGYQVLLRQKGDYWVVPMVSIAANTVLISLVLAHSGRLESYFWPMYLLPIFTACFYLEGRHVAFAVFSAAAFLGVFYLDLAENGPEWKVFEFIVKAAVLALSGGVTERMMRRTLRTRRALAAARRDLDRLALKIGGVKPIGVENARRRGILLESLLYDMQSQLMSVLGSAEVLLEGAAPAAESRRDLERIRGSARSMRTLAADLIGLLRTEGHEAELQLPEVGAQALSLVEFRLRQKSVALSRETMGEVQSLLADPLQLKHALLDLFAWAAERAAPEGCLRVRYAGEAGGPALRLDFTRSPEEPLGDLDAHKEVFALLGAELELRPHDEAVEVELRFKSR